jgi:hypothetical protein
VALYGRRGAKFFGAWAFEGRRDGLLIEVQPWMTNGWAEEAPWSFSDGSNQIRSLAGPVM